MFITFAPTCTYCYDVEWLFEVSEWTSLLSFPSCQWVLCICITEKKQTLIFVQYNVHMVVLMIIKIVPGQFFWVLCFCCASQLPRLRWGRCASNLSPLSSRCWPLSSWWSGFHRHCINANEYRARFKNHPFITMWKVRWSQILYLSEKYKLMAHFKRRWKCHENLSQTLTGSEG